MKGLLFTYALTYGGAVASLVNPWYGLLIYICFAIIKPDYLWYWSVPAGNYSRIIAIALLAGWALGGFGNFRFGRAQGMVKALVGFLVWSMLSAVLAADQRTGLAFVENMSKIVLPVVVGASLIDSVKQLKQLVWTIVLSQGYVAYDLNRSYYDGFNRMHQEGFGNMDNNCVAIAMVAATGLSFCLGLTERRQWLRLVAFAASGLMAHSVMFAFSRGGMLGLIITGFVIAVLMPKEPKHYAMFLAALLLAIRLAGPQVLERFGSTFADSHDRDESAQSRIDMWGHCLKIMEQEPLLGVGPDHFPLVATRFNLPFGKEAHSLWLQIGAELGIPGVMFLIVYYVLCLRRLWPIENARYGIDPWLPTAARMVIASLVGFSVSAQFVSLEGLELPYYVALLGAGTVKLAGVPVRSWRHGPCGYPELAGSFA